MMKNMRFRFCSTLKKKVSYVDEYEVLTNGNGPDKAIGEGTCSHNCPLKETCKFAKIPINHFL